MTRLDRVLWRLADQETARANAAGASAVAKLARSGSVPGWDSTAVTMARRSTW